MCSKNMFLNMCCELELILLIEFFSSIFIVDGLIEEKDERLLIA